MDKFLIIQTAFIGDAVLTLPMIQKLAELRSDSIIDVLCIPSTREIFSASPFVNKVLTMDKRGEHRSFNGMLKFINNIKANNYDRIYSPHRSFRTSLIVILSGVRDTIGFSNSAVKFVYKNIVEYRYDGHEIQRNLDLINYKYTDENWRIRPELNITEMMKNKIADYLKTNNIEKGFIAISPGSVWTTKRYPFEYFIDIIYFLLEKGKQVVLIGGSKDAEITSMILSKFNKEVFDSAGQFSLIESVELLRNSALLVTNDSAPTHLAMCTDIKVLTIYCSTIPGFGFYPYNKKSRYINYNDLYCKPCGVHGHDKCPVHTFDCGKKLLPEQVIKTISEMIN
jgi:heptosyltransferase II